MKQVDENTWWKYIDGECSEEEKLHLDSLLEKEPSLLEEMLLRSTLHKEIENIELETPSLQFTDNVIAALPEKRTITKTAPLFTPLQMRVGVVGLIVFFTALFTAPFYLEIESSSSEWDFSYFNEQAALILDAIISYLPEMPEIPSIALPTISSSSVQVSLALIFGTSILLLADKLMNKRFN